MLEKGGGIEIPGVQDALHEGGNYEDEDDNTSKITYEYIP